MTGTTFDLYGEILDADSSEYVQFSTDSNDSEIMSRIENCEKAYIYISHMADDESQFLPIRKQWSADSKTVTNSYHFIDEEGFEDSGKYMLDCVVSITNTPSGQRRVKGLIQMIADNQVVEDSFMTSDGRSFKSRQGRYNYCRRTGATYA
jgi:hypothetical protein